MIRKFDGLDDFELLSVLGNTNKSRIWRAKHRFEKFPCAIKEIFSEKLIFQKLVDHVWNERNALDDFARIKEFPSVPRLIGTFKTSTSLCLVMTLFIGIPLHKELSSLLEIDQKKFLIAQVVLILKTLHSLGYVYRDLKLSNVVVQRKNKHGNLYHFARLVDFGHVKKIGVNGRTFSICGTDNLMAPEQRCGKEYSQSVDLWSLGAFIYEMISEDPFAGNLSYLDDNDIPELNEESTALDLIKKLLQEDPEERLSLDNVIRHQFFKRKESTTQDDDYWTHVREQMAIEMSDESEDDDIDSNMIWKDF